MSHPEDLIPIPLPGGAAAMVVAERAEAGQAEPRQARRWYRHPALMSGIVILGIILFLAAAAPLLSSYNPIAQNLSASLLGPSAHHLLGTDQLGRDTWTRLLYGLRTDLRIAFIAVLFPFCLGTTLGSVAGYFGGWVDVIIMRLVDIVVAFPFYVLVIALVFVLGPGERSIYIAITVVGWVSYARMIRARSWSPSGRTMCSRPSRAACRASGSWPGTCCPTSSRKRSSMRCQTSCRTSWPS